MFPNQYPNSKSQYPPPPPPYPPAEEATAGETSSSHLHDRCSAGGRNCSAISVNARDRFRDFRNHSETSRIFFSQTIITCKFHDEKIQRVSLLLRSARLFSELLRLVSFARTCMVLLGTTPARSPCTAVDCRAPLQP